MTETNETIADIIAEMRGMGNYQRYSGDHARVLANRLDAAHKRERGDVAKLREALKQVNELNDLWFDTFTLPDGATSIHDEIEDVISAALSAPPRNCDVGTVEEQTKRKFEFCQKQGSCGNCSLNRGQSITPCVLAWAQMPYEEGGAK